jgi:hypothetical protein
LAGISAVEGEVLPYAFTGCIPRTTRRVALTRLGKTHPSNPNAMFGVGSDAGSRDSRAWVLPAM